MKRLLMYFVLLLISSTVVAQKSDTRNLDSFTSLSVAEGIDVTLVKGSSHKATISARNIDMDEVLMDVSGGTLKIHLDGNNHNNVDVNITLTFVSLKSIKASSAADIMSNDVIEADDFRIRASSAADISIELKVNTLEVEVSSAADVTLSGSTNSQRVEVSSAADYKAFDLKSKTAEVKASSAGDIRVNVSDSLDASANSGGSVRYKGNPDKLRERSSSGGDVSGY